MSFCFAGRYSHGPVESCFRGSREKLVQDHLDRGGLGFSVGVGGLSQLHFYLT